MATVWDRPRDCYIHSFAVIVLRKVFVLRNCFLFFLRLFGICFKSSFSCSCFSYVSKSNFQTWNMKDHSPGSLCSIQRRLGNEFCFCLNKCLHFRCCFLTAVEQDLWPTNEELMATSRLDPDCSVQLKGYVYRRSSRWRRRRLDNRR
jgi:hypothetical protein